MRTEAKTVRHSTEKKNNILITDFICNRNAKNRQMETMELLWTYVHFLKNFKKDMNSAKQKIQERIIHETAKIKYKNKINNRMIC